MVAKLHRAGHTKMLFSIMLNHLARKSHPFITRRTVLDCSKERPFGIIVNGKEYRRGEFFDMPIHVFFFVREYTRKTMYKKLSRKLNVFA